MILLAGVLARQGKYSEAESVYRETIPLSEKHLGKGHPVGLLAKNGLAGVLDNQGKHDEADLLYKETLQMAEEIHGKESGITKDLVERQKKNRRHLDARTNPSIT